MAIKFVILFALGLVSLCSANIKPKANFNALEDAKTLRYAVKGAGTTEEDIINVITGCSRDQRQELKKAYRKEFDRDLMEDLEDDISGDFWEVIKALMTPLPEYYANLLNNADEHSEIIPDLLMDLNEKELAEVIAAYDRLKTGISLVTKLTRLRQPLTSNMIRKEFEGVRNKGKKTNEKRAKSDARVLEKGSPQQVEKIFVMRNYPQLRLIFENYEKMYKKPVEEAFTYRDFHQDLETALNNYITFIFNKPSYYAKRLHESMFRSGTNNEMLIRILVSRSEKDLDKIKKKFEENYGESLSSMVWDDTSSYFRDTLMKIVEA